MEKVRIFTEKNYQPSPQKINKALMFPKGKSTLTPSRLTRNKEKPFQLFNIKSKDKEATLEELTNLREQILEIKSRNIQLLEDNNMLERELVYTKSYANDNNSKDGIRKAIIKEIEQLKETSDKKSQQIEKLKRSPKYTTFLELQVEKNVCLDRLRDLKAKLNQQRQQKQAKKRKCKELTLKMQERDEIMQKMKENILKQNIKLKKQLYHLMETNTGQEAKLKQLQIRNQRYSKEIEKLQKDVQLRGKIKSPRLNITQQKFTQVITQIILRGIRHEIPPQRMQQQIRLTLSTRSYKDFQKRVIGFENFQILTRILKVEKDIQWFIGKVKDKYHAIKAILSNDLQLHQTSRIKLRQRLSHLNKTIITAWELRDILKSLSLENQRIWLKLVGESFVCQDGLMNQLPVEKLLDVLIGKTLRIHILEEPEVKGNDIMQENESEQELSTRKNPAMTTKKAFEPESEEYVFTDDDKEKEIQQKQEEYAQDFDENADEFEDGDRDILQQSFDACLKRLQQEQKTKSPPAVSQVIDSTPRERQQKVNHNPSLKIMQDDQMEEQDEDTLQSFVKEDNQFYRQIYEKTMNNVSQNIIGSARQILKSNKSIKQHEINEIVSGQLNKMMKKLISSRISSVKRISQNILTVKDVEFIQRTSEPEIQAEMNYLAGQQARILLETLYDRITQHSLDEQKAAIHKQTNSYLNSLYTQIGDEMVKVEESRPENDNVRSYIGDLYRKITNMAVNQSGSDKSIPSNNGRDSLFIDQYLKAFQKNFSFI